MKAVILAGAVVLVSSSSVFAELAGPYAERAPEVIVQKVICHGRVQENALVCQVEAAGADGGSLMEDAMRELWGMSGSMRDPNCELSVLVDGTGEGFCQFDGTRFADTGDEEMEIFLKRMVKKLGGSEDDVKGIPRSAAEGVVFLRTAQ